MKGLIFAVLLVLTCSGCSSVNHGMRVPVWQIPFMILENEPVPDAVPDGDEPDSPLEA